MKKILQIDPIPSQEPDQEQGSNDTGCEKLLLKQCSPQKLQKQREFTVMKMCVCEMFGEEDVVFSTTRGYTVECASLTGQLLVIKSQDFMNRIIERSEVLREYVLERMETKRDYAEKTEKNFKSQFQKFRHFLVEDRTEQSGSAQQNRLSPIANFRKGLGKNLQISDNSSNMQQNLTLEKRSCSSNGRVNQRNSDKIVFNPSDNSLKNNESNNKSGCFSKSLSQYEESQNLTSPLQRNNSINRTKSNSTNEGQRESEQNQEQGNQNNNINHSNVDETDSSKSKDKAISFSKKTHSKNENDINSFSFFEIKVSKRQTIKMANRYQYYNYLQQNGSDERFLIPIKRTLNNVVFNKPPLLLSVLSDSPVAVALNRNNSPIIHKNIMNLQNSVPIVVKPGETKQADGQDWKTGKHNELSMHEEDRNYESNHRQEVAQVQRPSSEIYSTPKKEHPKSQNSQVHVRMSTSEDRQIVKNKPKKRLFLKAKLEPSLSPPKYELKFPQISFLTPQVNAKKEKIHNMYTDSDEQIDSFFKKSVFRDLEARNQKRIAYLRRAPPQIEFLVGNSEKLCGSQ